MANEERLAALEKRLQAAEDVLAIQNLMASYLNGCDGGWDRLSHDGKVVAPMFTEDGTWECEKVTKATGHEKIKALWDGFRESTPFSFHTISNPRIEVDGDTAVGEWHLVAYVTSRLALESGRLTPTEQLTVAIYTNHFVRTPQGWRIKHIHVRPAFFEPFTKGWAEAVHLHR